MNDDIAIEVKDLYKNFVLPHEKVNSIKSVFTNVRIFSKKKYEKQHALKGISFTVKKGEFFGIVGRNGSGKSTLLKLLAGIYQPTRGEIRVNGKIVPFIELGVGFNPELSGRDNVFLNGAMLGFSDKEVEKKYKSIVEFAELEKFMDQKLKNYSSGMQVRLAFSVATILAESDILLLDEVLAVGDADFQRKCYNYFNNLKKMNKTVIFVTHDMNAVREYCDRAILIDDNKIVAVDKADKVAMRYTKLFNQKKEPAKALTEENRWGDEKAKYNDVKSKNNLYKKNEMISISVSLTTSEFIEDPTYGFIIRDSKGEVLFGTNTVILGHKQKPLKPGDNITFEWLIPNIFNSGSYLFNPSIVYNNTMSVADWWEEATSFEVESDHHTPYPVNPDIVFKKKK